MDLLRHIYHFISPQHISMAHNNTKCIQMLFLLLKSLKWVLDTASSPWLPFSKAYPSSLRSVIRQFACVLKTNDKENLKERITQEADRNKYFHCKILKWGASSRWSSSLYFPKRNTDPMTIGKTHPTLSISASRPILQIQVIHLDRNLGEIQWFGISWANLPVKDHVISIKDGS